MTSGKSRENIGLPSSFPQSDYAPFGYIDNPYHSAVLHQSGVVRTVPPMGFGFWVRDLPWPYGDGFGLRRMLNYLSFIHLSINVDGTSFHTSEDFKKNNVNLVSKYHTKTMMSYDWEFNDLSVSAKYYLSGENSLVCVLEIENSGDVERTATVHATSIYGFPEFRYWGCDGLVSLYNQQNDIGVSKVWAYGDVFVIGANRKSSSYKATASEGQWNDWIYWDDLSKNDGATARFRSDPSMYSVLSYKTKIPVGKSDSMVLCLTRGVNESFAVRDFLKATRNAVQNLRKQLLSDEGFYEKAPLLKGDWPKEWKHGWIYDLETIRMNIRPPLGIYKHHWDAMQIHTPRVVLGESALDSMCLSYGDIELAKEVLYGVFADATAPNVPCSREDGSANMICANGKEAGTTPIWGLPFHVILSIYLRDRDDDWITDLYPYLKAYLDWWLDNRTDEQGWFHAACSWEAGQDASRRFLIPDHDPAAASEFVRTVDIEAAMANAMSNMILFAKVAGRSRDCEYWRTMAEKRIESTRSMFADGWFRDFDARTNDPIIIEDYYDVMMLTPVAFGIATKEQMQALKPKFEYFRKNPRHWLEWPSFLFPFSEAAWNAGLREFIAEVLVDIGKRIYSRLDVRELQPVGDFNTGLPEKYNYRIPGVSNEFWPLEFADLTLPAGNPGGCENYGWGATFPTLVIRNIIGFRESGILEKDQFLLAPALPPSLFEGGKAYSITNLLFRGTTNDISYEVIDNQNILIKLKCRSRPPRSIRVADEEGRVVANTVTPTEMAELLFSGINGAIYTVTLL